MVANRFSLRDFRLSDREVMELLDCRSNRTLKGWIDKGYYIYGTHFRKATPAKNSRRLWNESAISSTTAMPPDQRKEGATPSKGASRG